MDFVHNQRNENQWDTTKREIQKLLQVRKILFKSARSDRPRHKCFAQRFTKSVTFYVWVKNTRSICVHIHWHCFLVAISTDTGSHLDGHQLDSLVSPECWFRFSTSMEGCPHHMLYLLKLVLCWEKIVILSRSSVDKTKNEWKSYLCEEQ